MNITEDYVSFETAKLLKEKGFDSEDCFAFYKKNGEIGFLQTFGDIADYYSETCVIAPTLQMAMKWLRKNYGISIEISALNRYHYIYTIYKLFEEKVEELHNDGTYNSFEDAADNALKYCLENLI